MNWLAIANPAAGRVHEAERLSDWLRQLRDVDAEIVATTGPGDATRLARAGAAFEGMIAIGGDGTIAEVLRGMDLRRQQLAVLPAGHGNCLARDLGVADPARAIEALQRRVSWPLDLMQASVGFADGRVDRLLCASTLAVGYVTDVVMFGRRQLSQLGRAAYAAAAMVVVPERFEARLSGAEDRGGRKLYTGLVINNTAHLANFRGFPDASVRDGMLDVMEQDHGWPRQLLHNLAVLTGSRVFGPTCLRQTLAERLELRAPRTLMADGELMHDVISVAVECRAAAAMCVVGRA